MAEISANDAAQRYAAIEQAYSRETWATVLSDGQELLQRLQPSDNPQLTGLQLRLLLLLGHTQLYGYGDKAAAAGYYGSVAEQSGEAALTGIAEQGLKQCAIDSPPSELGMGSAVAALTGPAAPWLTTTTATATPGTTAAATAAAPWSEPSLIPDVVEEPELIELHQADPALADDVELSWQVEPATTPAPAMDTEDEELLSGLMLVRIR